MSAMNTVLKVFVFGLLGTPALEQGIERDLCTDTDNLCSFWASVGECRANPDWMMTECKRSCKQCRTSRFTFTLPNGSKKHVDVAVDSNGPGRPVPRILPPSGDNNPFERVEIPFPRAPERVPPLLEPQRPRPRPPVNAGGPRRQQSCNHLTDLPGLNRSRTMHEENLITPFETFNRPLLGLGDIQDSTAEQQCVPTLAPARCGENSCFHMQFRSIDGTCNNFAHPMRGSAFTAIKYNLPPKFDDGINVPTDAFANRRPPAREASVMLLRSDQIVTMDEFNALLMQWGQFISHDVVKTSLMKHEDCDKSCIDPDGHCMRMPVNRQDRSSSRFGCDGNICCIKGGPRTSPICGTGRFGTPREVLNENTVFIDASMIYGSSIKDLTLFREGDSPFLKMSRLDGRQFPPLKPDTCPELAGCEDVKFEAGDDRINVFVGLGSLHTLFMREHNRIADALVRINPRWNADRIFHEARKVVGAEMQVITYNEWLPKIIGQKHLDAHLQNYTGYDETTDPTMSSEVAGAAFRFGHGMVGDFFARVDPDGNARGGTSFEHGLLNSKLLTQFAFMDETLRGMMLTPAKRPQRTAIATTEVLFGNQDLAAINVQRGRDLGLPSYNAWREFCDMSSAKSFDDFADTMLDQNVISSIARLYRSGPDTVDLYVGALLEDPMSDGIVGPVMACLLGKQFKKLRDGDRLYYENPGVFTSAQLAEIKKASFSRILCDNGDSFPRAPVDAFRNIPLPQFSPCRALPHINLEAWREG